MSRGRWPYKTKRKSQVGLKCTYFCTRLKTILSIVCLFVCFVMLGIKLRVSRMQSKRSTNHLHPQANYIGPLLQADFAVFFCSLSSWREEGSSHFQTILIVCGDIIRTEKLTKEDQPWLEGSCCSSPWRMTSQEANRDVPCCGCFRKAPLEDWTLACVHPAGKGAVVRPLHGFLLASANPRQIFTAVVFDVM